MWVRRRVVQTLSTPPHSFRSSRAGTALDCCHQPPGSSMKTVNHHIHPASERFILILVQGGARYSARHALGEWDDIRGRGFGFEFAAMGGPVRHQTDQSADRLSRCRCRPPTISEKGSPLNDPYPEARVTTMKDYIRRQTLKRLLHLNSQPGT